MAQELVMLVYTAVVNLSYSKFTVVQFAVF